jgi:hypothetical protein
MTLTAPTSRWTTINADPRQLAFFQSDAPVNVCYAGRRSLKTEAAKRRLVLAAMRPSPYSKRRYFACGPTNDQSKFIFWGDLLALVPDWALATGNRDRDISHSDLTINLRSGATIKVAGLDRPARIEGDFWDGGVIDEFADCKPNVLQEHVLPMCVRPGSYVDVIGVPSGRNHFYSLVQQIEGGELEHARTFHWKASEVLHLYLGTERAEAFLAQARATLDPDTYDQEFNASFVSVRDVVYYSFSPDDHVEPCEYDKRAELHVAFDFNISPGVAILCQERRYAGDNPRVDRSEDVTMVLDEVWIESNSNTRKVCAELLRRYGAHEGDVWIYADASGGSGHSSQVSGSDLDLIEKCLSPTFGPQQIGTVESGCGRTRSRLTMDVPSGNPPVRARINSVNARLRAVDGTIRTRIDPKCKHLVRDLEGVQYRKGSSDIDKAGAPDLSHISDAFGYYVHRRHPMTEAWMTVTQF